VTGKFLEGFDRSYSACAFDVVTRPTRNPLEAEGASSVYPQHEWTAVSGVARNTLVPRTMTVINSGLPAFEVVDGKVMVTLLRCVNYLSRRGDGPQFETPDAQCIGTHTFRLAVLVSDGDWQEGKVWQQAHQFNVPLRAVQTCGAPGLVRDLPSSGSFVTVEPDALVVTAIKRAEEAADTLIVRFFNITESAVADARIGVRGAVAARLVNLNEEPMAELTVDTEGRVTLDTVRPKQIVTVAFDVR
jgi:alpha-mannosidase